MSRGGHLWAVSEPTPRRCRVISTTYDPAHAGPLLERLTPGPWVMQEDHLATVDATGQPTGVVMWLGDRREDLVFAAEAATLLRTTLVHLSLERERSESYRLDLEAAQERIAELEAQVGAGP